MDQSRATDFGQWSEVKKVGKVKVGETLLTDQADEDADDNSDELADEGVSEVTVKKSEVALARRT